MPDTVGSNVFPTTPVPLNVPPEGVPVRVTGVPVTHTGGTESIVTSCPLPPMVTVIELEMLLQLPVVPVTKYVPASVTTIEEVVCPPGLHTKLAAPLAARITESPWQKVVGP